MSSFTVRPTEGSAVATSNPAAEADAPKTTEEGKAVAPAPQDRTGPDPAAVAARSLRPQARSLSLREPSPASKVRNAAAGLLRRERSMTAPMGSANPAQSAFHGNPAMDAAFGSGGPRTRELLQVHRSGNFNEGHFSELTDLVRNAEDPAGATAAILARLEYDDNDSRSMEAFSPFQTLAGSAGVCRDQHTLAAYLMQEAGYDVAVTGYGSGNDILHRNMVFRDPESGEWMALEYGRVSRFPGAETFQDVVQAMNPGAMEFRFYDIPDGPNDVSRVQARVLTIQGERLQSLMRGQNIDPSALGATIEAGSDQSTLRYTFDNGTSVEVVKLHSGNEAPALRNGDAVIARHTIQSDDPDGGFTRFSGGAMTLDNVPNRTIGPRQLQSSNVTVFFLGMEGKADLYERLMTSFDTARGKGTLRFRAPIEYGAQVAYVMNQGNDEQEAGLMDGMMGLDVDITPRVQWDDDKLTAYVGVALAANEVLMRNIQEGGHKEPGQLPFSFGPMVGASYDLGDFSVGGEVRYNMRGSIDGRRPLQTKVSVGYDATQALGLGDRHQVAIGGAVETGVGDPVYPTVRDMDNRVGLQTSYVFNQNEKQSLRASFSALADPGDTRNRILRLNVSYNF